MPALRMLAPRFVSRYVALIALPVLAVGLALVAPAQAQETGTLLPAPPPFRADIDDPMLKPAPRPRQSLQSWEEALTLLRQSAPDERRAQAALERAEGRWRQALGLLLPNARLSGQLAYDILNPNVPPPTAGVGVGFAATTPERTPSIPVGVASATVTQSLVDMGAWAGLRAGEANVRSGTAQRAELRRRLAAGLAQTLVAVVAAERVAELNRLGLKQALERAALTERTQQLGAATELDVVRVRQDVEVARGTLVAGDEQLRRAREALGAAIGRGHDVGVSPQLDLDGLVLQTRNQCTALTSPVDRSDHAAAAAQVQAARESKEQARKGYLPTLGLASTLVGYTTEENFGRFSTWSIAAVISVPLWEGGSRGGLVRERAAIEKEAEAQLTDVEQTLAIDVAQARRGISVADDLVKTARASRELAARTDHLTRRSFEVGRSGSLELVQSAAALRQADVLLATREYELVQARLNAFLTEARCNW